LTSVVLPDEAGPVNAINKGLLIVNTNTFLYHLLLDVMLNVK